MNKPLSFSPVPMGASPKRNRTSILRSNDPIHILVTGSYWPRILIEQNEDSIKKKGKSKMIKPRVIKVEKCRKKSAAKVLKLLQQVSKTSKAFPLPPLPTMHDTSNTSSSSPTLSTACSWDFTVYSPASATPERPLRTSIMPAHCLEKTNPARPYSPTSILPVRPRPVTLA